MFARSPSCGHLMTCFSWKGYFHGWLFFSEIILPGIKTGSFTIEFRYLYLQNWYTLQDIQIFDITSQSTGQLIDSYLLTIKKKSIISREASKYLKGIACHHRKISKYLREHQILAGCFEFVLQTIIQTTSISHTKRQNFNRAPDFVSVLWLCTIQNTSIYQAKTARNTFLQNSSQWLLSNASYFFRKVKTEKKFHFSRSSRCVVFCK